MTVRLGYSSAITMLFATYALGAERPPSVPAPQQPDPIAANDQTFMATYTQQYLAAFGNGAIPAKYKQLSGVTVALVVKCEDCVKSHVRSAIKLGATRQEIVEALRLGLVTGGSAVLPTMGAAYEVMDQVMLR